MSKLEKVPGATTHRLVLIAIHKGIFRGWKMKRIPSGRVFRCMSYGAIVLLCLFCIITNSSAVYERSYDLNCGDDERIDGRCWHSYTFRFYRQNKTPLIRIVSDDFKPVLLVRSPNKRLVEFEVVAESGHDAAIKVPHFAGEALELLITSFDPHNSGQYVLITEYTSDFRWTGLSKSTRASGPALQAHILDRYGKSKPATVAQRPVAAMKSPPVASIGKGGGGGGGGVVSETQKSKHADSSKPHFPWPPPRASAFTVIDNKPLLCRNPQQCHFRDVDKRLVWALKRMGYYAHAYYEIPNGFALVTRIEQINTDGTSKNPPARWEIKLPPHRGFNLDKLITAVFAAKKGYFRVIVFIITSNPFSQSDVDVHRDEAIEWFSGGYNTLPDAIRLKKYTPQHSTTVLIYEFEKVRDAIQAIQVKPGRFHGYDHLILSGIYPALEEY